MQSHVKNDCLCLSPDAGQEVCDFCSSPDVCWDIDCEDIILPNGMASAGGWAACNTCHGLFVSKQRQALEDRAVVTLGIEYAAAGVPESIARDFIHELHSQFWLKHGEYRPFYKNVA